MLLLLTAFVVISSISFSFVCNEGLRLRSFTRYGIMEHKVYVKGLLGHAPVKGRLDCISGCSTTDKCRYALYNPDSYQCRLYGLKTNVDKIQDSQGWQCWSIRKVFGIRCSDSHDCNYQHGQCAQGECSCSIGFSYDFAYDKCLAGCSKYRSSFSEYPNTKVRGCNIRSLTAFTGKQCMEACRDEISFLCIHSVFHGARMRCFLCNETWSNISKHRRFLGTYPGCSLFYRNC